MIHPIPPGTRDMLPDEMREVRAITRGLRRVFEGGGYGEVWTPALEYEEVLRTGDENAAGAGFRTFDEQGNVLALRSDMTIPIARVVATRYERQDDPLRLCYFAHAYRAVERGTGQQREFLQAGIELIGVEGPEGEAEVIALTLEALDGVGLARHRIGLGDGALYRTLLAEHEVPEDGLLERLAVRDLVGLERLVKGLGLPSETEDVLLSLPEQRGGPEVLEQPIEALDGLRTLYAELEKRGVADRVILDLGLVRMLGYYTGAVYEVYDPAVGFTLGGGGRYDELIGRFGAPRPACGIALDVQRVHIAQAAEEGMTE
jgi:ATP phosphoribosyltransferase regulatory subunit